MAAFGLTTEVLTLQTTLFPGATLVVETERLITEEGKGVAVGETLGFFATRPGLGIGIAVGHGVGVGVGVCDGGAPGVLYDTSLEKVLSSNDVL